MSEPKSPRASKREWSDAPTPVITNTSTNVVVPVMSPPPGAPLAPSLGVKVLKEEELEEAASNGASLSTNGEPSSAPPNKEQQTEKDDAVINSNNDVPKDEPSDTEPQVSKEEDKEEETQQSKQEENENHKDAPKIQTTLSQEDESNLDEAFETTRSVQSNGSGFSVVESYNEDHCLRILEKFVQKTSPFILKQYGGGQSRSIWSYVFGTGSDSHQNDRLFQEYRTLVEPDNPKVALATFVDLFGRWSHASASLETKKQLTQFSQLLIPLLEAASQLVEYGCLEKAVVQIEDESHPVSHLLANAIFNMDLSVPKVEVAVCKLLLGLGCRPNLLRGSHLLQSIRSLYHIYLTTDQNHNKTTAKAALQQLVTSVFVHTLQEDGSSQDVVDGFPSLNHRDAYLVLRSLCKLSMRTLPTQGSPHVGLSSSASNETWGGQDSSNHSHGRLERTQDAAQLVSSGALHPALESKLLALELILYILQNCDFGLQFLETCGPQFHAGIRNYLCVSLLKNCTDSNYEIVNCSLRIFVPVVRYFRTILKSEIEAFVTNVFFVILDSKNSNIEHKSLVVCTFEEICSDPRTLAEIFLNYDCDLSAVDLFHRIVNALSRLSRTPEPSNRGWGNAEEKFRIETRELRLDAMRALRQILASLHASIVEPLKKEPVAASSPATTPRSPQQNLVEIYGSKKKRRAEESEAVLRFNQKPSAGIAYAAKCKHIDAEDPTDVARYLLKNKDDFEKTQIGEYLGREAEYQNGFSLRVLHEYVRLMDFHDLVFDDAIRYFLSGFRLPGEAQKIDRIMEKFAERFTEQNPAVFPTADVAFILSFSIIMLNTDLHNPAIKEERRMTKEGFIRNNRGICDGQDLPEELLMSIFDRIKRNPISLKEDDEARERAGDSGRKSSVPGLPAALSPASFFQSHYDDEDRARENSFQKERDHIVRTTESLLKRRRHSTLEQRGGPTRQRGKINRGLSKFVLSEDSGLKDEYVAPMFEVTWGPALAAFSTAMESANGTAGTLIAIASDEELELAAENAAETIEVCLTGFRFAIGTAGLCGNAIARDAYMLALSRFSQLGTGRLLEPRHLRCVQTLLSLAREDGELLGGSWEHVFRALSEINRFHQLFHLMARNDRAAALAAERRRRRLEEKERKRMLRDERRAAAEDGESITSDVNYYSEESSDDEDSLAESGLFTDGSDEFDLEENMDAKAIDEANAREIYDAVSETTIEAIYERSSSLSAAAVTEFIVQLCFVSRAEISVGNNVATDLTQVSYRQKHALLNSSVHGAPGDQFHHTQPNIYNLQKLVEATHYNMASRPRLLFAELWVTVADHLTNTALHSNPAVAMYAVDSFRQLSIQYLQREELEVFEFQRRFLKPLETVMARSVHVSTKELLLNCVSRLMHVFGSNKTDDSSTQRRNGLRSGWVPILAILGFGGCDKDENIARMSFKILSDEIQLCLEDDKHPDILLSEYFVETTNALLSIGSGPHDEVCLAAIAQVVLLADSLAAGKFVCSTRRKAHQNQGGDAADEDSKQKLGLWWPVLLGLSRLVGDLRIDIRSKGLEALFGIVNRHFFPTDNATDDSAWETLQLIFRGVLSSILEYAEVSSENEAAPGLPEDFELFLSDEKKDSDAIHDAGESFGWLDTTFDAFMDECISLCLRSMSSSADSPLVEEVFAILNSSLISDSGALAVRGLRRLEQFVTSDLDAASLTDDVWATLSHMLQRCLSVRGLPKKKSTSKSEAMSDEEKKERDAGYEQDVKEFVAEDGFFPHRRYIGSNATNVIGLLLCSDRFAIALRWRLFLVKWLHRGVREWDSAADMLPPVDKKSNGHATRLPDYRETAVYGRKWINRLVLQLASVTEIAEAPSDGDPKNNRFVQGQKQVIESTEALLLSFVQKELAATEYRHSKVDEMSYKRYTALVHELLAGYGSMDAAYLKKIAWINPVLLSSCIRSKNEEVRLMVQKLVEKTSPVSAPLAPKSDDSTSTPQTSNASKVVETEEANGTDVTHADTPEADNGD